jgi:NADH-quinone oxidoreductase subunit H
MAGTLNFVEIVDKQQGNFWNWYFIPQIVGFLIFFVASIAELNRAPFDLAEGEQELVAGFMTEYTGMRWGLYMFGEYVNMVVMSAIIATLFLGGWRAPFSWLNFIPGFIWLVGKVLFLVFMYMWIRWTLPRYRYNQLMDIGWKIFLPLAIANLAVTAVIVVV